jgi:hypothetical protein
MAIRVNECYGDISPVEPLVAVLYDGLDSGMSACTEQNNTCARSFFELLHLSGLLL